MSTPPLKLISWNVNGIRAALKKGFMDYFEAEQPDLMCIQETKAQPEQVDLPLPEGYTPYWNSAVRKGYSGTLIICRLEPEAVQLGFGIEEHDQEGRLITLTFPDFHLVNVYTPNSKAELLRLDYREQEWDVAFYQHLKKLEETRPVIFCGDLNVAHKEIDLANPKTNRRNPGFTDEERAGFDRFVEGDFLDTFREFNQEPKHYSWWSYRAAARQRNIGWRIDYFCISKCLRPRLTSAFIHPDIMGSDHCPVGMTLSPPSE